MTLLAHRIATGFGLGRLPVAPGTWASLAAVPPALGVSALLGPAGLTVVALGVVAAGLWAADRAGPALGEDPPEVVIDEIAGQMLALVPAGLNLPLVLAAFLFFRLFDIIKPWPADALQRGLGGGAGIMADDVAAGLQAGLCVGVLAFLV